MRSPHVSYIYRKYCKDGCFHPTDVMMVLNCSLFLYLQSWQLQRLVYSQSHPTSWWQPSTNKHSQLLFHLLSRHKPKQALKHHASWIFQLLVALDAPRASSYIGGAMSNKVQLQKSDCELNENILIYEGLSRKRTLSELFRKGARRNGARRQLT